MPILDDEADRLLKHIEETVRRVAGEPGMQGITGLIDQWKADVEAGRAVERKLRVQQSPGLVESTGTARSRSVTSGDFVGKEEYTKLEQLDMLIVSLYLAFLAPTKMSERLLDTIAKYGGEQDQQEKPDPVVHLLGVGSTDASRISSGISRGTVAQSNESTARLATLLNEIIQEAGLAPRRLTGGGDIA